MDQQKMRRHIFESKVNFIGAEIVAYEDDGVMTHYTLKLPNLSDNLLHTMSHLDFFGPPMFATSFAISEPILL